MFLPGDGRTHSVSQRRALELLARYHVVYDVSLRKVELTDAVIEGHAFYGCDFGSARLTGCRFEECSFDLCFLDAAVFKDCRIEGSEVRNAVFALSSFDSTLFVSTNIIQSSFNGITGDGLHFDDCDLLHSRFNAATCEVSFVNCNVKRTRFLRTPQERLSFRTSNQEDAVFQGEGE